MKRRALGLLALLSLPLAAAPTSCGEEAGAGGAGTTTSTSGSAGGSSSSSSTTNATTSSSTSSTSTSSSTGAGGAPTCAPAPLPEGIPEGWVPYNDVGCSCHLFVPGSKDALPPPLAWGTCPGPNLGYDCRSLVVPGTTDIYDTGVFPRFDVLPGGTPILALNHYEEASVGITRNTNLVAEVDGQVRTAMGLVFGTAEDPTCALLTQGLGGGRQLLQVAGDGASGSWSDSPRKALTGGSVDDLHPPVLARFDDDMKYAWTSNGERLVGTSTSFRVTTYDWSMQNEKLVTSPGVDPDKLRAYDTMPVGDAVFFMTEGGLLNGLNVWRPATGAVPFVRWLGDPNRGAGSLGTDGIDMAWRYGEGRDDQGWYTSVTLMTAKYTTDPGSVVARPLRALHNRNILGSLPVVVGCGYAATFNPYHDHYWDVLIVRLADGRSWTVPGSDGVRYTHAVGITCTDLFVRADLGIHPTIVRVALDSLGPGEPAP